MPPALTRHLPDRIRVPDQSGKQTQAIVRDHLRVRVARRAAVVSGLLDGIVTRSPRRFTRARLPPYVAAAPLRRESSERRAQIDAGPAGGSSSGSLHASACLGDAHGIARLLTEIHRFFPAAHRHPLDIAPDIGRRNPPRGSIRARSGTARPRARQYTGSRPQRLVELEGSARRPK